MMEENYQYLVFFKNNYVLSDQKKKKIEVYLSVRRKSGGGECGPLTTVGDNIYCVAFKDQRDQQEVLKKYQHTVELSDGPLVFLVTDSPPTSISPNNTFSSDPVEQSPITKCSNYVQQNTDSTGSCSNSLTNDFTRRIVVLGKTGAGKSSLANTLLGENVCETNDSPTSGTRKCQAASRTINGKSIKLIDTPGFFDTVRCETEMNKEIMKCIIESAPGPHVFMIVLSVGKYTLQEKEIINKMTEYFSVETLKFATVLFTHGDQLPEGTTIAEFVRKSEDLNELIEKCGKRCNVIDNKYWKNNQDEYRSNEFQVKELLKTIDKIIEENGGDHYTHKVLEKVNKDLEQEQERLKQESPNLSPDEIKEKAKAVVQEKWSHYILRVGTDVLLKTFLGGGMILMKEEPVLALGLGLAKAIIFEVGRAGSAEEVGAAKEEDNTTGGTAAVEEDVAEEAAFAAGEGGAVK